MHVQIICLLFFSSFFFYGIDIDNCDPRNENLYSVRVIPPMRMVSKQVDTTITGTRAS